LLSEVRWLRRRAAEFIRFLRLIDRQTPSELDLHLILDNYAVWHQRDYSFDTAR
jgi:hypothetical protein